MGSMDTQSRRAATSRRYPAEQKQHAVRMVFALREELGTSAGTVAPAVMPPAGSVIVNRAESEQVRRSGAGAGTPALRPDAVFVETRGAAP